jgi:hypothetical protein
VATSSRSLKKPEIVDEILLFAVTEMARNKDVEIQSGEPLHRLDRTREIVVGSADRQNRADQRKVGSPEQSLIGQVDGVQGVGVRPAEVEQLNPDAADGEYLVSFDERGGQQNTGRVQIRPVARASHVRHDLSRRENGPTLGVIEVIVRVEEGVHRLCQACVLQVLLEGGGRFRVERIGHHETIVGVDDDASTIGVASSMFTCAVSTAEKMIDWKAPAPRSGLLGAWDSPG